MEEKLKDIVRARLQGDALVLSDLRMGLEPAYSFNFAVARRQGGAWQPMPPARAAAGEEVVITQDGAAVARLIPVARMPTPTHPVPTRPREFGLYAGWATIGPEFFEPLPEEELRLWEGGDE